MKKLLIAIPLLLATGCAKQTLALAEDPVERAATCGVVAAAQARTSAPTIGDPLSMEGQGNVLRHALLAGAQAERFSNEAADAVVKRMPALVDQITEAKWKDLIAPCAQAYPVAQTALPEDPLTAALGCDALSGFMRDALSAGGDYEEALFEYSRMERAVDGLIAPMLDRRGIVSEDARTVQRQKALSAIAKAGHPAKVMDACVARYS